MNFQDKNQSFQFYNLLCDIVGSEEVVRTRRDIFNGSDIVLNTANTTFISSGSKAEGLDLYGSDYDRMINLNLIRVYESLDNVQFDHDGCLLVMDTNDTKPGFTQLKLVNKSDLLNINPLNDWCEAVGEERYVSSKSFREKQLKDDMVIHGPCQSTPDGEYDLAICLRCKEWITPAQQWIHRSRSEWPHYILVTSAVQHGVLFVPIGCKSSSNEDLQWRISFSVTEKLLIRSFSHTQLLCYALMKIILKDIIKPRHGELVCSYFVKTIMFWLSEEISPSKWKPENIISSYFNCIRRLIYCVEYKTCLHYFIPENDLFEDRFNDTEHKALLDTLRSIYRSSFTSSVLHTPTFQNYRLEVVNAHGMRLSSSELSCFTYFGMCMNNANYIYNLCKSFVHGNDYISTKEMRAFMVYACVSEKLLQPFDLNNLSRRNKSFYKQYKKIFGYFTISLQSESISSWLLLASLFYKCKRFKECLEIIQYCLSRCTPEMIYLDTAKNLTEQTIFKNRKRRFGLLITCKYLIIYFLNFANPFHLLPNELKPLIEFNCIDFPPVVYSHVLSFLCYHHIGDNRRKLDALSYLEQTVKERYFVLPSNVLLKTASRCLDIAMALT